MQISRRDFFKKFLAMAAVGTMGVVPINISEANSDEELIDDEDNDEYVYGGHDCHLCQRDPSSCELVMYTCHKYYAMEYGCSVEISAYNPVTNDFVIVGEVYP